MISPPNPSYQSTAMPNSNIGKMTWLGLAVVLLLLYAANKTRRGHLIIFYGMLLILIFLFLSNYQKILPLLIITKGGPSK